MKINPPDVVARLVNEHQKLVPYFAILFKRTRRGRIAKWDDLISYGNIGLVKAVERFDPAKGGKLSTYAGWWIKKYFHKAVKEQILLWKVSLKAPGWNVSLDAPVGKPKAKSKHKLERGEVIAYENAPTPAELLITRDLLERFEYAMEVAGLTDREREIIVQRHGLDGGERKTQKQIAKKLELTRRRIGQIEKGAREKLEALSPKSLSPDFPEFS
jgi:RNA polymerase sigma factor (sigma-70 family)